MTKSQLHSDEAGGARGSIAYRSTVTKESAVMPGVEFTIIRLSFARRMELARRVLDLSRRMEFHAAGESVGDTIQANILACEIDGLYLRWGLAEISGLVIDGMEASADLLADKGPEDLAEEIVAAVKSQIGLSEDERKN